MAHAYHRNSAEINATNVSEKTTCQAWIVVLCASLFSFYEFIQMNMFNSISSALMNAFHIDAAKLGELSSFYFIANVVFLLLAGALLDRFSTKRVIVTSLAICIIGTGAFAFAHSFALACFFRFLTGIGSAFCFLSIIRLASRWFPTQRMALVTGLILSIAFFGALVSQTPMEMLAKSVDWRVALQIDAALGVVIFLLILSVVKDYPASHTQKHLNEQRQIQEIGFFKSVSMAFLRLQNWLAGLYVCVMNLPVGLLGGLWGVLYLSTTHHLSHVQASEISSLLFIGTMIGSTVVGWISDKIQMRRPPMFAGAIISLVLMAIVIYAPHLSYDELFALFFLIGICTSSQIIGYPLVAENSKRIITAMSVSVVNISVQAGSAIFQPVFGFLLDKHVLHRLHTISNKYLPSDFSWAMWIFLIGFVVAILIVFALPETRCQQRVE